MVENTPLQLHIAHWADWRPDLPDALPDVRFLPAMLRRRLDKLGRMALYAAWQCLQSAGYINAGKSTGKTRSLPTIFATRHGEVSRTRKLLASLAQGEELSPTSFSLSVHNSIAGLYTMARQDTAATTVIAAGSDTLPQALIEAAGCLHRQYPEVLLVYADDELPADYAADIEQPQPCIALALLLRADKTPLRLALSYSPQENNAPTKTEELNHPAAGLLNLLQNREKAMVNCSTERFLWQFECHG